MAANESTSGGGAAGRKPQVALITGAGGGLGQALALACGSDDMRVLVTDIDGSAAEVVAATIRTAGGHAEAAQLDVRDGSAVAAYVEAVWDEHGGIDLLINNAGVAVAAEAQALSDEDWDHVVGVNLLGVVHTIRSVYPRMVSRGRGRICNVSSMFGLFPAPMALSYTTSKFAVVGMSLALRAEAAALGIEVTCACPGFIDTGLFPPDRRPPGKLTPPPVAAARVLKGIRRNTGLVVFPFYVRALWWLFRLSPALLGWMNKAAMKAHRAEGRG